MIAKDNKFHMGLFSEIFRNLFVRTTSFSPSSESYVLNKYSSISQWSDTGPSGPYCFFSPQRFQVFSLRFCNSFRNDKFLDSSKPKDFADKNFKFDENGEKFTKSVENTVGKGEIARYEQFLLFPQCFQKTLAADTEKPGLVWERVKQDFVVKSSHQ